MTDTITSPRLRELIRMRRFLDAEIRARAFANNRQPTRCDDCKAARVIAADQQRYLERTKP